MPERKYLAFDLKRPCKDCPFRKDHHGFLDRERAREIAHELVDLQRTFSCHKTNILSDEESEEGEAEVSAEPQHCAGATIFLEKLERPNQWMRWMERIRQNNGKPYYDHRTMDMKAPVFDSVEEFVNHHARLVRPKKKARPKKKKKKR